MDNTTSTTSNLNNFSPTQRLRVEIPAVTLPEPQLAADSRIESRIGSEYQAVVEPFKPPAEQPRKRTRQSAGIDPCGEVQWQPDKTDQALCT